MKNALRLIGTCVLTITVLIAIMIGVQQRQDMRQIGAGISLSHVPVASAHTHYLMQSARTPITLFGMPHAQGTQLVDGSDNALLLQGAQIESPLNNMAGWMSGTPLSKYLNSSIFHAMAHDWRMNVLRLPISNWIYAKYPVSYITQLDQVVQEANAAGLYVVLDLHDNAKSGSPYGENANVPKVEDVSFWKSIAVHYATNAMVMFDVYNEPKSPDWPTWLHGGGTMGGASVVGTQDLVNAIRLVGARQVIVVEPKSSGSATDDAGWATVGSATIVDPNVMYSLHVYQGITLTTQQQDAKWGPILNHYPIYYGEWALLVNGFGASGYNHCKNIVPSQADQDVITFLSYMALRHANWSAWQFTPYHLIQDYTSFTPTTLDIPWTCGDTKSHAGMGTLVKHFLTGN